jgi:hypothetical protein
MTFDLLIAERRLKNTSRLVRQSMWLLFFIAAGLMIVVRRSAPARAGSAWILAGAIIAFMLSFALRDVLRKVGRHNAEDKIVQDVKIFLERQPAPVAARPGSARMPVIREASPVDAVPSRSAGFLPLQGAASYRMPCAEPVVFDAFPSRETVGVSTDFYAVLLPVLHA